MRLWKNCYFVGLWDTKLLYSTIRMPRFPYLVPAVLRIKCFRQTDRYTSQYTIPAVQHVVEVITRWQLTASLFVGLVMAVDLSITVIWHRDALVTSLTSVLISRTQRARRCRRCQPQQLTKILISIHTIQRRKKDNLKLGLTKCPNYKVDK